MTGAVGGSVRGRWVERGVNSGGIGREVEAALGLETDGSLSAPALSAQEQAHRGSPSAPSSRCSFPPTSLPCPALPCPALPCPALPCPALYCRSARRLRARTACRRSPCGWGTACRAAATLASSRPAGTSLWVSGDTVARAHGGQMGGWELQLQGSCGRPAAQSGVRKGRRQEPKVGGARCVASCGLPTASPPRPATPLKTAPSLPSSTQLHSTCAEPGHLYSSPAPSLCPLPAPPLPLLSLSALPAPPYYPHRRPPLPCGRAPLSSSAAAFQNERKVKVYDVHGGWRVVKDVHARGLRWTVTDTALSRDQKFL